MVFQFLDLVVFEIQLSFVFNDNGRSSSNNEYLLNVYNKFYYLLIQFFIFVIKKVLKSIIFVVKIFGRGENVLREIKFKLKFIKRYKCKDIRS